MKICFTILYTVLITTGCNRQPDEAATTLRLPVTFKQGYGPFYPGFGRLNAEQADDPVWGKTYHPIKGIPHHWSSPVKSQIRLDFQQFIYQQVRAGNLDQATYDAYNKSPDWLRDTTELSAKPIRCYIYVVRGFDEHVGKWAILVDTNNNLDFADETPVYPEAIQPKEIPDKVTNSRTIRYETYQDGQVKTAYVPITFRYYGNTFMYNFPRHAIATATVDGDPYALVIDPGLLRLDFEGSTIALASSIRRNGRVDEQKLIKVGDEIELGGVLYRNNGISPTDNLLVLEPVNAGTAATNPLQNGHIFQPFTDVDFSTRKQVSLQQLRGKYVYVDFWGTWCKGCVQDMPNLNALYQRIDKRKIEFIGINCGDSPDKLRSFLEKHRTNWLQVRATSTNKLQDRYSVSDFPTSVLLDPSGRIIARDLRGDVLTDTLTRLLRNQ